MSKPNPRNVEQIKRMLEDKHTIAATAKKFNVSNYAVFKIKNNIDKYDRGNQVVVDSISNKVFNDLHNIANNKGLKFPKFMKEELKKITDSYPDRMKQPLIN